jgi:transcriptional regulator with GAF, ATPase, and Fis domain
MAGFERFVIPPLRERSQDIPGIVAAILREVSRKPDRHGLRVDAETLEALSSHHWWDNVRELRLIIEEAAITSAGDSLCLPQMFFDEPEMVFDLLRAIQSGQKSSIEDALGFLEKTIVQRALMHTGFDFADASRLLNLTEQNLRYRIKKHSIYVPAVDK